MHQDLVQDDQPLGIQVGRAEGRPPHDVGEDVQAQREVLGQQADVEGGVLLGGEGVEVAADLVDRLGDGRGRSFGGALEQRCSRKWDAPASPAPSSRDPVPTQKPMHTERASSIRSVARDRPDGRTSVRIMAARPGRRATSGRRSVRWFAPHGGERWSPHREAMRAQRRRRPPRPPPPPPAGRSDDSDTAGPRSPNSWTSSTSKASSNEAAPAGAGRGLGRSAAAVGTVARIGVVAPGRAAAPAAVAPVPTVGSSGRPRRCRRRLAGQRQGDLALGVDVVHPDLDRLTQLEHVLDPLDPLALADLRDVEQSVPTGKDVDEGAELGDVDHLALVGGAHLGQRRVEDGARSGAGPPRPRCRPWPRWSPFPPCRRRRRRCRRRSPAAGR